MAFGVLEALADSDQHQGGRRQPGTREAISRIEERGTVDDVDFSAFRTSPASPPYRPHARLRKAQPRLRSWCQKQDADGSLNFHAGKYRSPSTNTRVEEYVAWRICGRTPRLLSIGLALLLREQQPPQPRRDDLPTCFPLLSTSTSAQSR